LEEEKNVLDKIICFILTNFVYVLFSKKLFEEKNITAKRVFQKLFCNFSSLQDIKFT